MPEEVAADLNSRDFKRLYIDGGKTIQSFLKEDLIDELIITRIPVLLGGGAPLFGDLPEPWEYKLISMEILLGELAVTRYKRVDTS